MRLKFQAAGIAVALIGLLAACTPAGMIVDSSTAISPKSGEFVGGPVAMRRLTQDQYRQTISDVFGSTIQLGGRFEPDIREEGLMAVGASYVSVTASGLEQYDKMARSIGSQIVSEDQRATLLPCVPASSTEPDENCARQILSEIGRYLFRRPMTDKELDLVLQGTTEVTQELGDFYTGLSLGIGNLLAAPQFLFVQEISEPDPNHPGELRLDSYSKAARLSFLFWNSTPDDQLLKAAQRGDLHTTRGVAKQVDRMLASRRVESGIRAFFSDMLGFDAFDTLAKDATLYPKFSAKLAEDAKEQTLRTIVEHLVEQDGDYRSLFTTGKTFLTPRLGAVYRLPVDTDDALLESWAPYEYAEDAPQAGILTHASFVALHSPPGRSSPTDRGKALREVILCQKVPAPPGDVNFTLVQDTESPVHKTARARLNAHATEPMCTGCHKITDPIGLALENFDTIAGYRTRENGELIDLAGNLDGIPFTTVNELGQAFHDSPAAVSCLVDRLFAYSVGHKPTKSEKRWIADTLLKQFEADGYRVTSLLKSIATSDTFFRVVPAEADAPAIASAATNLQ